MASAVQARAAVPPRAGGDTPEDVRGWAAHLRAYRLLLSFSFQTSPWHAGAYLSVAALQQIIYLTTTYGGKLMVDAVVAGARDAALWAALVWAGSYGAGELCQRVLVSASVAVNERVGRLLDRRLVGLLSGLPGIEHYERPDYLDQVALLRSQRGRLVMLTTATGMTIRQWTILLGSAVLLARVHPVLLLLPLVGLGSMWTGKKAQAIQRRTEEANAQPGRLRRHLFETATSASVGKELRVFGLADEIVARHRAVAEQIARETVRGAAQRQLLGTAGALLFAAGYVAAVALVLVRAVRGQATPGDVVLAIGLAAQMSGSIAGVIETGNNLRQAIAAAARYMWLEDYARAAAPRRAADPLPVPKRLTNGITLDRVSFRYPGTDRTVLSDVSLVLPAGAVVALVGENGAGKTTLVKLLCGFYQPDEGRLLVDGIDVRRFDVEQWRSHLSAAFQDFARFEFRVGETVGLGDLPRIDDPVAVQHAIARAGAEDILEALPDALETPLGKPWGGAELSGGQWQKLALARALMRDSPLLLVLDEPTAALDAPTEHALFERFTAAARSGETRGAVTLLVSHRFSTVRMADLIVVLDRGRVVAAGTHADLMAQAGLYAELYNLQARAYRT